MTLEEYCRKFDITDYYVSEFDIDYCKDINFIIDEGATFGDCRKPYMRMRGKKVTPVQAFDILSKTEGTFYLEFHDLKRERFCISIFGCHIFDDFFNCYSSFVRPDGYLGTNEVCGIKHPRRFDFFEPLAEMLYHFPYLDFVVAVTDWEEIPDYAYETWYSSKAYLSLNFHSFEENIEFGFHVYNGTIHHLNKENARKMYEEYNKKYGYPNEAIYCSEYYKKASCNLLSNEYIAELFNVHGKTIGDVKSLAKKEFLEKEHNVFDDELRFMSDMLIAERRFGEPKKFIPWHVAQFIYDAVEMGYSYKDAWSLLVGSTVGTNLLRGIAPDASASEADTELRHRYEVGSQTTPRYSVERTTPLFTTLLEVVDRYNLSFEHLFDIVSLEKMIGYCYSDISCEDLYNFLMEER